MLGWRASVSPEDNRDDGVSRRQDSYVRWRGELGEVKVVGPGRGPKLRNLGRKGDHVTDFNRPKDGGRGREDHNAIRDGSVIGSLTREPERGGPLERDEPERDGK